MVALMFHSVGLDKLKWASRHISEPIKIFEQKIKALKKAGFEAISFQEACSRIKTKSKTVCLTFDDGYLDNWVHVFPILKKYNMRATIFVTPEFVDPRHVIRPLSNPDHINEEQHDPEQCCAGFLSWNEMKEMEKSGLIDIQSHGLTHAIYFKGAEIDDFWYPGAATEPNPLTPVWMLWNIMPEAKPFYLTKAAEYETKIPYGTPIYEYGPALATKRYFPTNDLNEVIQEHIQSNGNDNYFQRNNWRDILKDLIRKYRNKQNRNSSHGYFETDNEYLQRVNFELSESKKIIEHNLQKKVDGLCWPGGGVTEKVLEAAMNAGYKYFTLPSAWKNKRSQIMYPHMLPRMTSMSAHLRWRGRDLGVPSVHEFVWQVKKNSGYGIYVWPCRIALLARLGRSYLGLTH